MAEYLITGGGAALDDALNMRNGFSYTNGDILRVGPGIYSPVNFAYYRQNVEIRSTDGKENTIIDANHLTSCLNNRYTNSGYIFKFYGFTLKNGYIYCDISGNSLSNWQDWPGGVAFPLSAAAINGSVYLYDSNIFDCESYCEYPYDKWKNSDAYGNVCGIASANGSHAFINCEISGCRSNTLFSRYTNYYYCDFHHNECTRRNEGDKYAFQGGNKRKSKFHHNKLSGLWFGSDPTIDCLIYRNEGISSNNWLGERTRIINSVIANNVGFKIEDGWGGATYWKNVVCYNNKRTDGTYAYATFYGNGGRSQLWNCYFDQLSTTFAWGSWNELSGNKRKNCVFIKDADFGFVDPENDDYRLRPDSMLISAGTWAILSGKAANEETINYNGTSDNKWLSTEGDYTSRPYKDPPSVGAYEYIEEKENLPNDVYPFGGKNEKAIYAKEVEYLSSDGTVCLETNCIPTNNSKFRIIYNVSVVENNEVNVIGLYDNTTGTANRVYMGPYPNGGNLRSMLIATESNITGIPSNGQNVDMEHICDIPNALVTAKYSGTTKTKAISNFGAFVTQKPLGLFGRNVYTASDGHKTPECRGNGKIYIFEAWESGVQTAKYIPVVDLNGVACFYDEIGKKLHYPFCGNPLKAGPNKTT